MQSQQNSSLVEFILGENTFIPIPIQIAPEEINQLPVHLKSFWDEAERAGQKVEGLEERGQAIGEQCLAALLQCSIADLSDCWLPDLLAALVQQKVWSAGLALSWVEQMVDWRRRTDSLLVLVPLVGEPLTSRLLTALKAMRPYKNAYPFSKPSGVNQYRLSERFYISESLGVTLEHDSAPNHQYIHTLAKLVPFLPVSHRAKAVDEILAVVFDGGFFRHRHEPLAEIIQYLPESEIWKLVKKAYELPTFRTPEYDNPQAETLLVLLPRLAEMGYVDQSLQFARAMPPQWEQTALCFLGMARHVTQPSRLNLLLEAREAALTMNHNWFLQKTLVLIAIQLAQDGHLSKAVSTIRLSEQEDYQVWAQAQLLAYLPDPLRDEILADTLLRMTNMAGGIDIRRETLQGVAIELARKGEIKRALDCLEQAYIKTIYWWERTNILSPVVPRLVEMGYGKELLDWVHGFQHEGQRIEALAVLARYLPTPLSKQALKETLEFQPKIGDWTLQARTLASLTTLLPGNEQPQMVTTILMIRQRLEKLHGEHLDDWLNVLTTLVRLFPNLPESLQHQIVEEALVAAREYKDEATQIWFLAQLLLSLEKPFRKTILDEIKQTIGAMDDSDSRTAILPSVTPFLTEVEWQETFPEMNGKKISAGKQEKEPISTSEPPANPLIGAVLSTTLKEACSINAGYGYRATLLQKVVPSLLNSPVDERYALWCQMLRDLATQRYRKDILN